MQVALPSYFSVMHLRYNEPDLRTIRRPSPCLQVLFCLLRDHRWDRFLHLLLTRVDSIDRLECMQSILTAMTIALIEERGDMPLLDAKSHTMIPRRGHFLHLLVHLPSSSSMRIEPVTPTTASFSR